MSRLSLTATLLGLASLAACGNNNPTHDLASTSDMGVATDMTSTGDMTFVPPTIDVTTACGATQAVTLTTAYPAITSVCATSGCHSLGATFPNMSGGKATFFTNVVGVTPSVPRSMLPNLKLVAANGDPNNSFLLYKIVAGQLSKIPNGGSAMPLSGALTTGASGQLCQIVNWVRSGALNN